MGGFFLKENIKSVMLNEFEKQIDEIISFSSNEHNFNQIINLINNQKNSWRLCRFDIQNIGNEFNRINILENFNNLYIDFPSWFRNHHGQGCQIQGSATELNLKFQCVNDGTLRVMLRGVDYRNFEQLRCPVYVNFTTFKVNNKLVFDDDKLIWHDQPYEFEISINDKDILDIYLEFKSIYEYYPSLLNIFNDVSNFEELNEEYYKFKKQIKIMHILDPFNEGTDSSLDLYQIIKDEDTLILGKDVENLSYNSFLSFYNNYLNVLEMKKKKKKKNYRV